MKTLSERMSDAQRVTRVIHIARPVTTLNSDLTCCGKYLGKTNWVCFEGNGDYSASNCEVCIADAQKRRSVSALARDKVAGMRGQP